MEPAATTALAAGKRTGADTTDAPAVPIAIATDDAAVVAAMPEFKNYYRLVIIPSFCFYFLKFFYISLFNI